MAQQAIAMWPDLSLIMQETGHFCGAPLIERAERFSGLAAVDRKP